MCSINSLFPLILYWVVTLCLCYLCQFVTKRGRFRWIGLDEYVGILFVLFRGSWNCFWKGKNIIFFNVSNLGGELVCIFVICFSLIIYGFYVFLSTHVVMCSFECFQEREVRFDQDLLPLIATSRLGVLDWDFCCIWAFLLYCVVLVFEHFILYVNFVTNCQIGRLLGFKSLE